MPYQYEFICLSCGYIIIKTKNQLTKTKPKKQTFSSRLKYSERKF